jgi:hypothetical protein
MKKILRDSKGSLTLEATIVFPVFLALLLLLINLVNISLTYIAMDHAVRETVKQIAVQAYPLKYLKAGPGVDSSLLPQAAGTGIVNIIGNKIKGEATNIAVNALTKVVISAKIEELYPLSNFAARDAKVTVLNMYNPNNVPEGSGSNNNPWDNKDIAVKVEYKIKPLVPFLPLQEIVLSNSAVERAWVDE